MVEPERPLRAMADDPVVGIGEAVVAKLDALTSELRRSNKNGKNGEIVVPRWLAVVVSSVVGAAIIGLFGFVLNISARLAVQEAEIVPAPQTQQRLMDHERRLGRLEDRIDGR